MRLTLKPPQQYVSTFRSAQVLFRSIVYCSSKISFGLTCPGSGEHTDLNHTSWGRSHPAARTSLVHLHFLCVPIQLSSSSSPPKLSISSKKHYPPPSKLFIYTPTTLPISSQHDSYEAQTQRGHLGASQGRSQVHKTPRPPKIPLTGAQVYQ